MDKETAFLFGIIAGAMLGFLCCEATRRSVLLAGTLRFAAYVFTGGFTMLGLIKLFVPTSPSPVTSTSDFLWIPFVSFTIAACPLIIAEHIVRRTCCRSPSKLPEKNP